jgi:predicted aminopeptidase
MLLSACESTRWYWQAGQGQVRLWRDAQSIERLLADPGTAPELRERLRLVTELVAFGAARLGLDDDVGYHDYVALDRPFVVWNVFAAPPFRLELRRNCFPIAGCVGYRGYFSKADAQRAAQRLQARGLDVYVGGVAAYSTLGWLDDPVLSSWLWRDPIGLAALVFHELAHQRLYVAGDTQFSESLASTLEEILVADWLEARGMGEREAEYQARVETRARFAALIECARQDLHGFYAAGGDEAALVQGKAQRFEALRASYREQSESWAEPDLYDRWIAAPLNNAKLLAVSSYRRWVPALRGLYRQSRDMDEFLAAATELAELDVAGREARLEALAPGPVTRSCAPSAR